MKLSERDYIGIPEHQCTHCGALVFREEISEKFKNVHYCCHHGAVPLDLMVVSIPQLLQDLLLNDSNEGKHFRNNIRKYNTLFAFTSIKANLDKELANGRNVAYTFRVSSVLHHFIPENVLPPENRKPRFAQIYFYDPEFQLAERLSCFNDLKPDLVKKLQTMLFENSALLRSFPGLSNFADQEIEEIRLKVRERKEKEFDLPQANEVGAILPSHETLSKTRELIFRLKILENGELTQKLKKINQFHHFYDSLHYVLLFPCGESGWRTGLAPLRATKGNQLSLTQYYRFKLFSRKGNFGLLLHSGSLYQQLVVDAWSKVEEQRLSWVRNNQKTIRAETYTALSEENDGRKIILPPTYIGSPRYFSKLFQDSLAIVRRFGKPTFFLTMTTNIKWTEILENLPKGVSAADRPDIICRVFNLKAKRLIKYIRSTEVLGKVIAFVYRVEFQKRGLPHLHCLIISDKDTIRNASDVDKYVSAEIPDKEEHPVLFDTVTSKMIPGPCKRKPCWMMLT